MVFVTKKAFQIACKAARKGKIGKKNEKFSSPNGHFPAKISVWKAVFQPVLNLMINMPKEGTIMKKNTVKDIYNYSDAQAVATILGFGLVGATVVGIVKIIAA